MMQPRRIAIVQLQGTPDVPGLVGYRVPADPPAAPASCQLAPWLAAASGLLTMLALWERFSRR